MKKDNLKLTLYAVTDRTWLKGETLLSQVEKAIKGGADIIQLREKDLDEESFLKEALEIKTLCRSYNVPLIINDSVSISKKADADGVHIGQSDMNIKDVRKILNDKIIGVSVQTKEQAILAEKYGADYLGAGAVFNTSSKNDAESVSIETLKEICASVSIPVVAIGGIGKDNVMKLSGSKISGVAVISALFAQDDIEKAAKDLKKLTFEAICNG